MQIYWHLRTGAMAVKILQGTGSLLCTSQRTADPAAMAMGALAIFLTKRRATYFISLQTVRSRQLGLADDFVLNSCAQLFLPSLQQIFFADNK